MADTDPLVYAIGGLVAGGVLFVMGFRWWRQKKLIEELPTSKIRSIAMGLVEIKASVVKEKKMLISPFSKKECVYWRYTIERWIQTKNGGHWSMVKQDKDMRPFYVKDNTGEVLVDPDGATIDTPPDYTKQTTGTTGLLPGIISFCKTNNIHNTGFFSGGRMRYREWYIEPGDNLYILGTAGDNPFVKDTTGKKNADDIMIQKGQNEKFYYISDKPEESLLKSFRWKVFGGLFGGAALILAGLAYILFRAGLF
ncbi:TPA: hypothetical protein HA265_07060 [Candidatus Woesearchaeota archaeon]|nr:hypothetical protein [Candidatus Woesearchaeota archaeon]